MITQTLENNNEYQSIQMGFDVNNMDDIFDILANMYSRPIEAAFREYLTNGIDSQITKGNLIEPIEITFPTEDDLTLTIRDFGLGLSRDEMETIYNLYAKSTKKGDRLTTGQLGIGSKSGFSVSKAFNVISFYDGIKYTYIQSRDLGKILNIHEEYTTEQNGVQIQIPIESDKINEVIKAAKRVLPYVDFPWKVTNHTFEPEISRPTPILSGKDWSITNTGNSYAIMGNVAYPINSNQVINNPLINYILNAGLEIEFPNGTLNFAPSREELKYNDFTKSNLNIALKNIILEIQSEVDSKIEACENVWDAFIVFSQLFPKSLGDNFVNAYSSHFGGVNWRGIKVSSGAITFKTDSKKYNLYQYSESLQNAAKRQKVDWIYPDKNNYLIVNDYNFSFGQVSKVLHLLATKPNINECHVVCFENAEDRENFIDAELGDIPYYLMSEMEKAPLTQKERKANRSKHQLSCFQYEALSYSSQTQSDYWKPVTIDYSDNKTQVVYTEIYKFLTLFKSGEKKMSELAYKCKYAGIDLPDIIGIKTKELENKQLGQNWIKLEDYLLEKINEKLNNQTVNLINFANRIEYKNTKLSSATYTFFNEYRDKINDGKLKDFIVKFNYLKESSEEINNQNEYVFELYKLVTLNNSFEAVVKLPIEPTYDLKNVNSDLKKEYPLLSRISEYRREVWVDDILQYVNLIDKK